MTRRIRQELRLDFVGPGVPQTLTGVLVADVRIGDFAMPWEKKDAFWKWATDDSGMEQVGTVYTAQGFEFDYIGSIKRDVKKKVLPR